MFHLRVSARAHKPAALLTSFLLSVACIAPLLLPSRAYASTAVGRTQGVFGVSRTSGAATYTIPIWAPPGPKGLQPHIALTYNSQQGNGPVGVGWSLSGLSAIYRCTLTFAQDAAPAPITLTSADRYCLDGQRLRLYSGTYGAVNSTYQTEVANFSLVTASSTATGNGPAFFTVQTRDGLTYTYGSSANNAQLVASGTAFEWLVSAVSDRAGNTMKILYTVETDGSVVPGTISWTPSGHGLTTYNYNMNFIFGQDTPQSSIFKYVAGTAVQNTYLLNAIQIVSGSTTIKRYQLGYRSTHSPTTGRAELTTVTECSDDALTTCMAPTTITYQDGGLGVLTTSTAAVSASSSAPYTHYDFNGDGYPDLLYKNSSNWFVAFGSASGYGTPVNTGISSSATVLAGNLLGNGQDRLLANNGGTWFYYTWNGTSFGAGTSTGFTYDTTATQFVLADTDGDGLPDLIKLIVNSGGATVYTSRNTGNGASVSFQAAVVAYSATDTGCQMQAQIASNSDQANTLGTLRSFDFDGDGRQDVALQTFIQHSANGNAQCTAPFTNDVTTYELISNGATFTAHAIDFGNIPGFVPVTFLNWNSDACTDFMVGGTIYIAGCNGSTPSTFTATGTVIGGMDWDGDGRTDLLVANGSTIGVYLSKGNGVGSVLTTSIPYTSTNTYFAFDADGDGLDDLGFRTSAGAIAYFKHNGAAQPPDLLKSIADGYGNSASPTYASIVQSAYTEHVTGGDATYPYSDYIGPLYVVNKVTFSDPSSASGATYFQTFAYYSAWTNLQGRGFSNFQEQQRFDSRPNSLWEGLFNDQKFPYTGILDADDVTQDQARTKHVNFSFIDRTSTVLDSTAFNQRYFVFFDNSTDWIYELGGTEDTKQITTSSTDFVFNASNYGIPTSVTTTITDTDPNTPAPYNGQSWTTATTLTPDIATNSSSDLPAWCLSLIDEIQVAYSSTLAGSTAVTRTKTFTPDTNRSLCRIASTVTEPTANSALYKVTEAFAYDSFGNVMTDTITGANMPSSPGTRVTSANWGTTGQFLTTLTDPSNAVTTWTYTTAHALGFGVPDSVTDANNLPTSWTYDGFGRKITETRPDKTSTTWGWTSCVSHCGFGNSEYEITQTSFQTNGTTVIRADTTLYDPVDRVTQTSGPSLTGTTVVTQAAYDSFGNLSQRSMPFLSGGTVYEQTYTYDALNRVTLIQRPISSSNSSLQSTNYGYAGRTQTVTDWMGNKTTKLSDVNGWLRQTKDAVGYAITLAYDAAGSKIGVSDSAGNTLSTYGYKYGIAPFLVSASDADLGSGWTFTVDSLGETVSWTDAKTPAQSFSMTYDALSRPLTRTEPDLITQWTWGSTPGSFNVGQLTNQCTASVGHTCATGQIVSDSRTFDTIGRLATRSISQAGNPGNDTGGVFQYTFTYSSTTGFPDTLTYPISTSGKALVLQYAYQNGYLQSITDKLDPVATCGTSCTLWTATATDAMGHVTNETLGNNVKTSRTYDAVTGWLSKSLAGVGGGTGILNQSYLQDKNGNIIQRQNNNLTLTESFGYDADNRLSCFALASTCTTPTVTYDGGAAGPGNITSQTGVGTYTYPAAGQPRPHAVTSITGTLNGIVNPTFAYDANGNMTNHASASQNVFWTSYNYPSSVSGTDATGTEMVSFAYGPDRKRWQQVYQANGAMIDTTYYIGGLIDEVVSGATTTYRHYIYAGGEQVAVYSRSSGGTVTMSYLLEDHEDSISAITSNAGTVSVSESFTPFGNRRNPTTWSGAPTTGDLNTIANLTRQGYTFQTALGQSMGLNHMNGRVQDAITGRFLSPDPLTADSAAAQSYNRYSYVINNPLTWIDPSGFRQECFTETIDEGETTDNSVTIHPVDITTCLNFPDIQSLPGFGAGGSSPGSKPPRRPLPKPPCVSTGVRVLQGIVGGIQVVAGLVQGVEGILQTGAGVFGAFETGGLSLLAVPGGIANAALGGAGIIDGGEEIYVAVTGQGDSYSTFNNIGQQFGGEIGGKAGDVLNLAGQVLSAALSPPSTAGAALANIGANAANVSLSNAGSIGGRCGP